MPTFPGHLEFAAAFANGVTAPRGDPGIGGASYIRVPTIARPPDGADGEYAHDGGGAWARVWWGPVVCE